MGVEIYQIIMSIIRLSYITVAGWNHFFRWLMVPSQLFQSTRSVAGRLSAAMKGGLYQEQHKKLRPQTWPRFEVLLERLYRRCFSIETSYAPICM